MSLVVWLVVNKLQGINLDPGSIIEPAKHIAQLVEEKTGYDLLVTDNLVKLAPSMRSKLSENTDLLRDYGWL